MNKMEYIKLNEYQKFESWYVTASIKFEIVKYTKNKEFVLLVPKHCKHHYRNTRALRCHNVQHLDFLLWKLMKCNKDKQIFQIYYSLAKYVDGIPKFGANLKERNTSDWTKNHWKRITGFDCFIDIDAGDHTEIDLAHESTKIIKNYLDKYSVPYKIRFSGCGFHIIIPYAYFKNLGYHFNPLEDGNIYDFYNSISHEFYNKFSEMVDTNLSDCRRIIKCPYTLAFYENKCFVCMPLTDDEFNNFTLESMKPQYWLGRVRGRVEQIRHSINNDCERFLKNLGVQYNGKKKENDR